jgi:hypothetical protein
MVNRTLLLLPALACACVSAFTGDALVSRRPTFQQSSLRMGGAGGAPRLRSKEDATISRSGSSRKFRDGLYYPCWHHDCGTIAESP